MPRRKKQVVRPVARLSLNERQRLILCESALATYVEKCERLEAEIAGANARIDGLANDVNIAKAAAAALLDKTKERTRDAARSEYAADMGII